MQIESYTLNILKFKPIIDFFATVLLTSAFFKYTNSIGGNIQVVASKIQVASYIWVSLSPFSAEPDLKKRIRVHLLNAHGLDEAGIDGGGIFREFLNELLKSGFNPNQGFFKTTNEGLLYPNPAAQMLVGDSYARHYYFLGRMLGKVKTELYNLKLLFSKCFWMG